MVDRGQNIQKDGAIQYGFGFNCVMSVAGVILEYGIPVAKVISWIRKARALYGGVEGILYAIQIGAAQAEVGEEAATILAGILGLDSVINACFG